MVKSVFDNLKISAVATAVPTKWTSVEEMFQNSDEKIMKRFIRATGILGKYDAISKQTASDLAYVAAQEIIKYKKIDIKDIGVLLFVTQTPDYLQPTIACVLHKRLGLSENCVAFDVNQGCAGMIYGINIACALLNNSNTKKALVLLGDTVGKSLRRQEESGVQSKDDKTVKLFGDAGAAILIEKEITRSQLAVGICTDGVGYDYIIQPYGLERHYNNSPQFMMKGTEVFDFSIDRPPLLIKQLMDSIATKAEDYDCLVLHQANKLIVKQVAKYAGFTNQQNLISVDRFGNTTSASIATALTQYYGNDNADESIRAMLCGFGIGLTWGAVSVDMNKKDILPLIMTDEYFEDGF